MPTNSPIKGLLFLTYKNMGYLPVNLDYNFDLNLQLQVLRHSVKQAEDKVGVDSSFGWLPDSIFHLPFSSPFGFVLLVC